MKPQVPRVGGSPGPAQVCALPAAGPQCYSGTPPCTPAPLGPPRGGWAATPCHMVSFHLPFFSEGTPTPPPLQEHGALARLRAPPARDSPPCRPRGSSGPRHLTVDATWEPPLWRPLGVPEAQPPTTTWKQSQGSDGPAFPLQRLCPSRWARRPLCPAWGGVRLSGWLATLRAPRLSMWPGLAALPGGGGGQERCYQPLTQTST